MNYKLVLTYLVYAFAIIGTLTAALYPLLSTAKEVEPVALSEGFSYNYSLGDTVPEFVIDEIISRYATGTKAIEMKKTIYCESHYYNVQSNVINRYGQREDSWGIAQINLYWNPSVSLTNALDPEFAIKWMSDNWGHTKWYGWNRESDSCNPVYK